MHQIVGSIIKAKPEFEERYIILHQYTFPQVLDSIRKSNIRNYSIFLKEGLLFSYYEYHGDNLRSDMSSMADDIHTQNWWKLTDPMQEPVPFRAPDEWWAEVKNVISYQNAKGAGDSKRVSLRNTLGDDDLNSDEIKDFLNTSKYHIRKFSLFSVENLLFLYAEISSTFSENDLISQLNLNPDSWVSSKEVFHTD